MTTRFFCHFGEFGYEIFGWLGKVNEYQEANPRDRIVICGRAGCELLYPYAYKYLDISRIPTYLQQSACRNGFRGHERELIESFQKEVIAMILADLPEYSAMEVEENISFSEDEPFPNIYESKVGTYSMLKPDLSQKAHLESELGFALEEKYVLIQNAWRASVIKCGFQFSTGDYKTILARYPGHKKVFMVFDDHKYDQSKKDLNLEGAAKIYVPTLAAQSCLIHFADKCIFFTEGDFRSHMYLPPLFGKDVEAHCSSRVTELRSCAVTFWNENVYTFGGKMKLEIHPC